MPTMSNGVDTTAIAYGRDFDLPMLASQAAIEVDNAILGRATDFDALKQVVQFLRSSFERPMPSQGGKYNLDLRAITIVGRVLFDVGYAKQVDTVSDLVNKAWEIADRMEKSTADSDTPTLEQIRAFCIAVANGASSYWQSLQDLKPTNPYKR